MAKILIVDDEPRIRELIREHLQYAGYVCEEAGDGSAALSLLSGGGYDLVILDLMMPFMDGMTCLREMRTRHINTPVIILTARGEEYDKLAGLEGGADDYVVKPFSLAVLYAKALALLRRARGLNAGNTLTAGTLSLDPERGIVIADGRRIDLPPKEFALLRALMERKNRVLTRDELLNLAWGWDFDGTDRVIDGHIKKLRWALGPHADCIKTVVKRGYKLEVDGDENQT